MKCQKCGSELRAGAKFCDSCGTSVPAVPQEVKPTDKKQCPYCFTLNPATEMFCSKCQKDLTNEPIYDAERYERKRSTAITIIVIIIAAAIALALFPRIVSGCGANSQSSSSKKALVETSDWTVMSKSEYVRDGEDCVGYHVYYANRTATDSELLSIFKSITDGDNYYLHTVWIYFSKYDADGSGAADITIEEKDILGDPVITR